MLEPCKCDILNAQSYAFRIPLLNIVQILHVLQLNIDLLV